MNLAPKTYSFEADLSETTKTVNTALVSTQGHANSQGADYNHLEKLVASPAFQAIVRSVRALAREEGISEHEAAESVIGTFRSVDSIWRDFVIQKGISQVKKSGS